jgi:hypothetical protein
LVEEIPSREGMLSVIKCLVDHFPDEAHFWGHLGRLYSMELKDDERGLGAIDRAIALDPDDHVLHHIRGMALRRQSFEVMAKTPTTAGLRAPEVREAIGLVAYAEEAFDEARELAPAEEHAFVSHIQLLLRALDFGFRVSGIATRA